MKRIRLGCLLLALSALPFLTTTAACSSPAEHDPCETTAPPTETNGAAPCLGTADAEAKLGMVRRFRQDTTMAANLALDVAAVPVDYLGAVLTKGFLLAFGIDADTLPSHAVAQRFEAGTYAFDYDRKGPLGSEAQLANAHLRLYWPVDSQNAKKGDLIATSILDKGAFLVNPRVSILSGGKVSIAHDGPGPLVEILGQTATPPNPLVVSTSELSAAVNAIEVDGDAAMTFDNACNTSAFHFAVPRQTLAERKVTMIDASGQRKDSTDRADVRTWDLAYASTSPSGKIRIEATAGAAPIVDDLTFTPANVTPASTLACR